MEMDFDDVVENAGMERGTDRQREESLSPRERFYGIDNEVPVLLWAPSPYTNSPLYQVCIYIRMYIYICM